MIKIDKEKSMKLTFEVHFIKKAEFLEADFLKVVSQNLTELGSVTSLKYQAVAGGYLFEVEYVSRIPGITYQPILGCFSNLENEYPYISNLSIPSDKMR